MRTIIAEHVFQHIFSCLIIIQFRGFKLGADQCQDFAVKYTRLYLYIPTNQSYESIKYNVLNVQNIFVSSTRILLYVKGGIMALSRYKMLA